jgi:hypothetical protein
LHPDVDFSPEALPDDLVAVALHAIQSHAITPQNYHLANLLGVNSRRSRIGLSGKLVNTNSLTNSTVLACTVHHNLVLPMPSSCVPIGHMLSSLMVLDAPAFAVMDLLVQILHYTASLLHTLPALNNLSNACFSQSPPPTIIVSTVVM